MKRSRANPFDYLFLVRPTLLIPVWTFLLLGYYWGMRTAEFGVRNADWGVGYSSFRIPPSTFLWAFLLYSALMSGVYILNQVLDRETDRMNQKLFLLSERVIPVKFALMEMGLLFLIALTLSISMFHFTLFTAFVFLSLVMGILYSVPPIKIKGRPFLDLLWNSTGFGLVSFSVGWLTVSPFSLATVYHSIPYVLSVGAVFLNTTIPDISGDEKAGDKTTGVLLGRRRTAALGTLFLLFALLTSFLIRDSICFIAALFALPPFLLALKKEEMRFYLLSIRIGAPLLVLLTIYLYPFYLLLLVLTYFSMRIYYQRRFHLAYPSLFNKK
ncbi:UbiA family prenyltransferase [candidate division TA06 bacterium]|nr:UbiA family prenyltransferase [candidate division TA06 bacterium]